MYPSIILQPGREKSLFFGHPWVFSRAIRDVPKGLVDGSLVSVFSNDRKELGVGYFNSRSQITIRMLKFFDAGEKAGENLSIDAGFFEESFRVIDSWKRQFLDPKETNAYRLIFAEGNHLPGLIVDRYHDFLVIQIHTLGMEKLKNLVVKALVKVFQPKGIYERSDIEVRRKEGLHDMPVGVLYGEEPPDGYEILEYGLKFLVDIKQGQKTGFFLDQRENRNALRAYASEKNVLNLFSYSGGFSLSALAGGAKKVTSVDISEAALELATKNFTLNGFKPAKHEFVAQDVFAFLDDCIAKKRKFDLVVVDPPAFVKSKESLNNAVNAYIRLNEKALHVLNAGGIFVSSSCSSHVSQEMFRTILFKAALKASADLVLLENKTQPFDHPLRVNFPEGEYLKFYICQRK